MRAGTIGSVALVVIVTALAAVASLLAFRVFDLDSASAGARLGAFILIMVVVSAAALVPAGVMLDRALTRLRQRIERFSSGESSETQPAASNRWLEPVANSLLGAMDQCRQREQSLRGQLGDLEIRQRVAEAQRRQVEAVLHALRDAVIVTDGYDELVIANLAALNIVGDPGGGKSEINHRPLEEVIRDKRLCQLIREARQSADFVHPRHIEIKLETTMTAGSKSAGPQVFDVTFTCVRNHKGDVGGVVTILHDLTRERELSQMKSDFVSKVSHELRTPLSSIRAYVEMLVDGEAADEAGRQEFYRVIHDETDRLSRLIDNMLNISRIEAGIVPVQREWVDFRGLVEKAVATIEPQASEKKISVHARLAPPEVDLRVQGDQDMLYQVLLNLLSNSVKYTPEGGRVTIAADAEGLGGFGDTTASRAGDGNSPMHHATKSPNASVVISVTDNGLGIPPDALPKLFDKFFRIENYKRVAKGTGLGLSLCKHIVETVHHGQIGVDSKLGMGSKFWFTIPVKYEGASAGNLGAGLSKAA